LKGRERKKRRKIGRGEEGREEGVKEKEREAGRELKITFSKSAHNSDSLAGKLKFLILLMLARAKSKNDWGSSGLKKLGPLLLPLFSPQPRFGMLNFLNVVGHQLKSIP
jgi:hypothetical protein